MTRNRPKSRGDVINEAKITRLQNEINDSKQAVVKHILHARTLQNDLSQVRIVDKALKAHLKAILKTKTLEDLGKRILWLEKGMMNKIERLSGSYGYGANLQQSLNAYNDDELCDALQSLPGDDICYVLCMLYIIDINIVNMQCIPCHVFQSPVIVTVTSDYQNGLTE